MKIVPESLKKDSWGLGIGVAIGLPLVVFGILTLIKVITIKTAGFNPFLKDSTVELISIFINMFTLRYYLVKLTFDKTGRGILLVTFIMAIAFFVVNLK